MKRWVGLTVALLVWLIAAPLRAQEATVTGRVADSTGAVVPGASVTLTSTATRVAAETVTNAQGLFSFPSTSPGLYSVTVTLSGFASAKVDEVRVEVAERRDLTVELQPAGLEETVVVAGAERRRWSPPRAERSRLVVEQQFVQSIPLNIRNPLLMINSRGRRDAGARDHRQQLRVAVGDQHVHHRRHEGDDQRPADRRRGEPRVVPQPGGGDSAGRCGRGVPRRRRRRTRQKTAATSGAVVQFSLRSGTNQLHGSATEFFRDDRFDANSFDANRAGQPKAELQRNQYGFTLGGPLVIPGLLNRDRTFFFAGYEGLRQEQAGSFTATVPTALERRGDFSQTRDANGNLIVIYDPRTTRLDPTAPAGTIRYIRDPFPGNRIPAEPAQPGGARTSSAITRCRTRPGQGQSNTNNYFSAAANVLDIDRVDMRVDHTVSNGIG